MVQNDVGEMVERWIIAIDERFTGFRLDEYIVMPDHTHWKIIEIYNAQFNKEI